MIGSFLGLQKCQSGFTLIELVTTLAVLLVLLTLAVPGYESYARRARRIEAMSIISRIATAQERHFFRYGRFATRIAATANPAEGLGMPVDTGRSASDAVSYKFELVTAPTLDQYTLSAVPAGAQSSDSCGTLTLSSLGTKHAATSGCW